MKRPQRSSVILFFVQILIWAGIIVSPAFVSYLINHNVETFWPFLWISTMMILPSEIIYMACFYWLIPCFFFKKRKWLGGLLLTAMIWFFNSFFYHVDLGALELVARIGIYSNMALSSLSSVLSALAALAIRSYIRNRELQVQLIEAQRKNAEAELNWLKNQLNPHFLFNSLNNISSLTQIDPDQAQEAILELSDMLRYALYESNKALVPLASEAEFMQNYVAMMRLRYSSNTTIETDFQLDSGQQQVAPLLFISFVENAFKHGVSSTQPSYVGISMRVSDEGVLVFCCRNTNFPKSSSDRSGSGIGLENTHRRLDLLYPDKYTWSQQLNDNIYEITITIKL